MQIESRISSLLEYYAEMKLILCKDNKDFITAQEIVLYFFSFALFFAFGESMLRYSSGELSMRQASFICVS